MQELLESSLRAVIDEIQLETALLKLQNMTFKLE